MPKTAIIHIGTRKTGTTSIQETLANSRDHLWPVRYPLVGPDRDQNRIISLYLKPEEMPIAWQDLDPGLNRQFSRAFFRQLRSVSDVIISAEALSSWFPPAAISRLRMDLEEANFTEFCIILYIRDPAEYYLSYTQQVLKSSSSYAPEGEHPGVFRYEFRRIAEMWEDVFPGALIVRKYKNDTNKDVVTDFCEILREYVGVNIPKSCARRNQSLSAEAMKVLQDYRLQFPDIRGQGFLTAHAAKLVMLLQAGVHSVEQSKAVLREEIAEGIRANHKEDAEFIFSRYGIDLGIDHAKKVNFAKKVYRVSDLVERCEAAIIQELLLLLTRSGLEKNHLARYCAHRVVSRAYERVKGYIR